MELLVPFRQLQIDVDSIRKVMDHMTWSNAVGIHLGHGLLELSRYEGSLVCLEKKHTFTPFPKWASASHWTKFSLTERTRMTKRTPCPSDLSELSLNTAILTLLDRINHRDL